MTSRAAVLLALSMLAGPAVRAEGPVRTPTEPGTACGAALGEGLRRLSGDGLTLAWRARAQPIPLDRHFEIDVAVCGRAVTALRVDADMPVHRHGMNYRATVENTGEGRYRARGLLFHMPGRWRLSFDVDGAGGRQRLIDELELR